MKTSYRVGALFLFLVMLGAGCGRGFDPDQALQDAFALQQQGDLIAAGDLYQQVLEVRPDDKLANYNLGIIEANDGRVDLAEGYYRAAFASDPDFTEALFNLAILRTSVGDDREARDLYLRVIAIDPTDAAALFNVGMLYKDSGHRREAERYLNRALELDPTLTERLTGDAVES